LFVSFLLLGQVSGRQQPNYLRFKPIPTFQAKIYSRVLTGLSAESTLTVGEVSWCVQLTQEMLEQQNDVDRFISNPNILELLLGRVLRLESCPDEIESIFTKLVSDISRRLTEDQILWLETLARKILENWTDRDVSISFLQTLLCSLPAKVLGRLEPEVFTILFRQASTSDKNEKLSLAVAKIRF
jgi:hypothetical protein